MPNLETAPNPGTPPASELPSSRTLLRSTAIAVVIALVLLVTVVLPAEYGTDPTGIGRVLGLTEMGEIKMTLAREAAAAEASEREAARNAAAAPTGTPAATVAPVTPASAAAAPGSAPKADSVRVVLPPGESKEVKLIMRKGARVTYAWSTDRGTLNFETHGDTLNAPPGVFHSYGKGRGARSDEGSFVAVFDGMHGWFWRNRTSEPVTVTLRAEGEYQEMMPVK
jgi:hypothetical protein